MLVSVFNGCVFKCGIFLVDKLTISYGNEQFLLIVYCLGISKDGDHCSDYYVGFW